MNPKNPTTLEQKLRNIAPALFESSPVLFAYLYGSYAEGKAHPFSDLDVAIYVEGLERKACLETQLSLALKIDEMLDHHADSEVRALNDLSLTVKGKILLDGKLIYTRNEDKRIQFETQVRLAYFDFLPVIQHYQNIYREKARLKV